LDGTVRIPYEACPLCSSKNIAFLRADSCVQHALYDPRLPPLIRWMRCADCTHVFTDSYFDAEATSILYSKTQPNQVPAWNGDHAARLMSSRMVSYVLGHRPSLGGRWLDVGFGNGLLLAAADEFGFDVVGLDARQSSVDGLRARGFEAHATDLADFQSEPFDVISMADVVEHVPFPKTVLEAASRLLREDGLLLVTMPNIDCFGWRSLDALNRNPYWGEIEHFHNFGRRRLHALLREHGFDPRGYRASERYYVGMEVVASRVAPPVVAHAPAAS
jgi:SAM-dependent methyltransferase